MIYIIIIMVILKECIFDSALNVVCFNNACTLDKVGCGRACSDPACVTGCGSCDCDCNPGECCRPSNDCGRFWT